MFASLKRLRTLWSSNPSISAPRCRPVGKRKLHLGVEALEQRDVPTITFQPHYGPQTVASNSHNAGAQHPTVNVILSGSYWTTTNGTQDANTLLNSMKSILSGPYLTGLTEYGSDGRALFGAGWTDTTTPLATDPSSSQLQTFLQTALAGHNASPGVHDYQHAPIELVLSDPAHSTNSGGFNSPGTFRLPSVTENMTMIHMGTIFGAGGHVNKDWVTTIFGHEITEAMSDPGGQGVHVIPPSGQLNLGDQIGDNEAEMFSHYGYRLNGDWLQPYWSVQGKTWILPDGNQQTFALVPIWHMTGTVPSLTDTFTGHYQLNLTGDQLGAGFADNVQINRAGTSVSVALNYVTATFEPGTIDQINVNTLGGANTVSVAGLPSGVTLNIDSTGFGNTNAVTISSNGSLSGIQGTVNIADHGGQSSVVIDDSADIIRNITLTNHSVAFAGSATINYTAAYRTTIFGIPIFTRGVTSLTIKESIGSRIDAESVGALTTTSAYLYAIDPGNPVVYGPAAHQVHLISNQTHTA